MIGCEGMLDRMPEVAAGRSAWTEDEHRHLETCQDCPAAWTLMLAVRRLGESTVARIDPAAVAAAVVGRLAAARRADRVRRLAWVGGLAAAAVLVLLFRRGPSGEPAAPSAAVALVLPVAELDSLDRGQLQYVLDELDPPLTGGSSVDAPPIGDLDEQQMERVLNSMGG
ncbi:MAG: hypothetical protein ACREMO_03950 [Gemmatimonadales bacterium]